MNQAMVADIVYERLLDAFPRSVMICRSKNTILLYIISGDNVLIDVYADEVIVHHDLLWQKIDIVSPVFFDDLIDSIKCNLKL